ncbi:GerAB/ArcD/ProY family transporter [Cohnella panacarvi]|uniref:GerAB/ArcD/ProY family transporter n=1 Tax=Cohnella panacarvi TaxID=400776 RepID=UPI00047D5A92|nr:GerAB/ArcD/ProY family transporter [Cohnella panacarvi]
MRTMKEALSYAHVVILIYMVQTGVTVFSLPQIEAQYFGTNGWLSVLFVFAAVSVNIFFMALVYRIGNGKSIFDLMEQVLPKWTLIPLYGFLIGVWSMIGLMIVKEYVLIFQMMAFPTTDPMLLKLVVDLLILYLVTKGIYNIGKAASVFFWLNVWMLFLLFFFFGDFDWSRMTTFVFQGGEDRKEGFIAIASAFLGYELCMLLFPYADRKTKIIRATLMGNGLLTFSYLTLSIVAFGFFSVQQLKEMMFPLLDLMAYIVLPFVERLENFFYGLFLFSIIVTSTVYLWAATETSKRLFPRIASKYLSFVLVAFQYAVSFLPDTLDEVKNWLELFGQIEIGIAIGLPLFVLILLIVHKATRRGN